MDEVRERVLRYRMLHHAPHHLGVVACRVVPHLDLVHKNTLRCAPLLVPALTTGQNYFHNVSILRHTV